MSRYLRKRAIPDAEDLTRGVAHAVLSGPHRFQDGVRRLEAWGLTITKWRLLNEQRKRRGPPATVPLSFAAGHASPDHVEYQVERILQEDDIRVLCTHQA